MIELLLILIFFINFSFLCTLIRDLRAHRNQIMLEPATTWLLPFSSFIIFFLSTFGISDFAISTALYAKLKWIPIKKIPGTLNTQCVIPLAVMALSYISTIRVDFKTLAVCMFAAMLGAYISPRLVVKLAVPTIKKFVTAGLVLAALLILANKLNWIAATGTANALTGWKLMVTASLLFIYGGLSNIGIGSYALTMATVYTMGLTPVAAFPIMMGAATCSISTSSIQFVKLGTYSRKITLFASIFGVLGVLTAVFFVKNLDTSRLQWLVIIVLLYSALSMAAPLRQSA